MQLFVEYQSGKSTTLAALTGNWGFKSGNGIEEETNGVYADGPFELNHFYERFGIDPLENLFFNGNEYLTPVVFVIDIEGYGGKIHGTVSDVNNEAFVKLCTPFFCLSSAFFFMSDMNPDIEEITKIINITQISNLTIKSNLEGNGGLKLIVGIKNYPFKLKKKDINEQNVLEQIKCAEKDLANKWYGLDKFQENGIISEYSPMVNPVNEWFSFTFKKFAEKIIRSIENASQGNYMRCTTESMELFDYIVDHYNDSTFKKDIKDKILQEHNNSMKSIAFKTMNECVEKYKKEIDGELLTNKKKKYKEKLDSSTFLEKYKNESQKFLDSKLKAISDSPEVINYMKQANEMISKYIHEKLLVYQKERGEFLMEKNLKYIRTLKDKNKLKNYISQYVNDKYSSILLSIHNQKINELREDLSSVDFYKSNFKNLNAIEFQILEKYQDEINTNISEIMENCRNEIYKSKKNKVSILKGIFSEVEQLFQSKEFILTVYENNQQLIQKSIITEFNEAKENLAEVQVLKKKRRKKIFIYSICQNIHKNY